MRVSKPPSGLVSTHAGALPAAKNAGAKGFADQLAKASRGDKAHAVAPTQSAAHAGKVAGVADLARDLRAGKITPKAALDRVVDRVVERIVARQVGAKGPAAVRERLAATLRQTLEDDPMLATKIRALDEG
jgi:hypothetical protein